MPIYYQGTTPNELELFQQSADFKQFKEEYTGTLHELRAIALEHIEQEQKKPDEAQKYAKRKTDIENTVKNYSDKLFSPATPPPGVLFALKADFETLLDFLKKSELDIKQQSDTTDRQKKRRYGSLTEASWLLSGKIHTGEYASARKEPVNT